METLFSRERPLEEAVKGSRVQNSGRLPSATSYSIFGCLTRVYWIFVVPHMSIVPPHRSNTLVYHQIRLQFATINVFLTLLGV